MTSDINDKHIVIYGGRGFGKDESARISMGMTRAEWEDEHNKTLKLLENAEKQREQQNTLKRLLWVFYDD
jgi:hypothetical protein